MNPTRNARPILLASLGILALALSACGSALAQPTATPIPPTEAAPPTLAPSATPELQRASGEAADCSDPFEGESPGFPPAMWDKTNFCVHSIPYSEVRALLPPDQIPAIDDPVFESIDSADEWLDDDAPVTFFEWNGDSRAYPLAIMVWHEIVNDIVGDQPVSVTFCPLCNATIVFNRELADGTVLDFGTSGSLRNSDLVMYDRSTQSWWQQFTGEAIVGEYTGTQLEFLPSQIISWGDFKASRPEGTVLSRATGHVRSYGQNPYAGYDDINSTPFAFSGEKDDRLLPMQRVVAVTLGAVDVAYPFEALEEVLVVNDEIDGTPIVVLWKAGTLSSFPGAAGLPPRDVGSSGVFESTVDGQVLTFSASEDGAFIDDQTQSVWNIFGEALEGELEGSKLTPVVSAEHFWFAWAVFKPETLIWSVPG